MKVPRINLCHSCGMLQDDDGPVGHSDESSGRRRWYCSPECLDAPRSCPLCGEAFDDPADIIHHVRQYEADVKELADFRAKRIYEESFGGQVELLRKRVLALTPWPLRPLARLYLWWCRRC